MNASLKLDIGMEGSSAAPDPSSYTRVTLDLQLHKEKIQSFVKEMREKTGIYRVPTMVMEIPESMKNFPIPINKENEGDNKFTEVQKDGKIYKCYDILDEQFVVMKKKFEKLFGKVTELNNVCFLHIDLYNIDTYYERFKDKDNFPICTLMEKSKFEASFNLDPQFWNVLEELVRKIAPKFADSPVMALLPLLGSIQCEIQMDSLAALQPSNKQELFGFKRFEDPDDDEEGKKTKENFNNKEKVAVYISLDNLGFVKFELQARMFALYSCLH